jgi:hypothetical protein
MSGTHPEIAGPGVITAAISNAMVGLLCTSTRAADRQARAPRSGTDIIVCVMGATLTKGEQSLVADGKQLCCTADARFRTPCRPKRSPPYRSAPDVECSRSEGGASGLTNRCLEAPATPRTDSAPRAVWTHPRRTLRSSAGGWRRRSRTPRSRAGSLSKDPPLGRAGWGARPTGVVASTSNGQGALRPARCRCRACRVDRSAPGATRVSRWARSSSR